jgi:hypothetical protein
LLQLLPLLLVLLEASAGVQHDWARLLLLLLVEVFLLLQHQLWMLQLWLSLRYVHV